MRWGISDHFGKGDGLIFRIARATYNKLHLFPLSCQVPAAWLELSVGKLRKSGQTESRVGSLGEMDSNSMNETFIPFKILGSDSGI